ncbi:M20/M25/M40 family metallo-hydrolase [Stappia stellulata]|uniref:M20/M25/M40 family metallo-hydrolase n=1 Tax=Stappia stellulata TaxID=71235 RepID=UPI00041E2DD8|nr:M20/M25/M40 family metallo-hydrolase [Stappia stellulata]
MTAADDARFSRQVDFLKQLIRVPSENPPGDMTDFAEATAAALRDLGFEPEWHPVPEPFVRQAGMRSVVNLIVRRSFGDGGPVVALSAHGDVIPAGEGWSVDPFGAEEAGGALYGRGTVFGKSDISAYVFALLAVSDAPDGLNGTVEIHITCDEEAGGTLGPRWLLGQDLSKPDCVIASGFSRSVTTAHNGCLQIEIVVRGRAAHAAAPDGGVDALETATGILSALYGERDRIAAKRSKIDTDMRPLLTIGVIQGGVNTNVVPDRVALRVDRRLIPEETGEAVEDELFALVEAAVAPREGLEVECRRLLLAEPLRPVKGADTLADIVQTGLRERFPDPGSHTTGSPLFSDARHYADAGIPTVLYGSGPVSLEAANAYSADEHVQLEDLRGATDVVAAALRMLLDSDPVSQA